MQVTHYPLDQPRLMPHFPWGHWNLTPHNEIITGQPSGIRGGLNLIMGSPLVRSWPHLLWTEGCSSRVPTAQGKQGKWSKEFPVRENTGNLEILPKHREFGLPKL